MDIFKYRYKPIDILRSYQAIQHVWQTLGEEIDTSQIVINNQQILIPKYAQCIGEMHKLLRGEHAQLLEELKDTSSYIVNPQTGYEDTRPIRDFIFCSMHIADLADKLSMRYNIPNDLQLILPPTISISKPGFMYANTICNGGQVPIFMAHRWIPPTSDMVEYAYNSINIFVQVTPPYMGGINGHPQVHTTNGWISPNS